MVSPIYEYTSETYINVSLFQICVEDKDKEDEIDAEGEDGHNNQEDNKMNRIMEHRPEAQPAIPTWTFFVDDFNFFLFLSFIENKIANSPRAIIKPTIAKMLMISQIQIQTFWFEKSHPGFPSFVFINKEYRRMTSAETW